MDRLKEFHIKMIRNYILGSFLAVFGIGSIFIFHTLKLEKLEVYLLFSIMIASVIVMVILEYVSYKKHIAPIRLALSEPTPSFASILDAYRTIHRFPILTVKRILGPHLLGMSMTASILTMVCIYLGYIRFPYYYVGLAWAGAALVAITHAMIEFFLAYRSTQPLIQHFMKLATEQYGTTLTLSKKDTISIKTKLLISSIFIAIIPILLFTLASEVRISQDSDMNSYWSWAVILLMIITFLAVSSSMLLYENIQKPIDTLLMNMSNVRNGKFHSIDNLYSDEFGELITGFNHMVSGIQARDQQNDQLVESFYTIFAATLDARDPYTAGHSKRVADYSVLIAREAGLDESQLELIRKSALLHDIGKIGIRDTVLLKEGHLTDEEFDQIKQHPVIGANILVQINLPGELAPIVPGVKYHHERWDGKGYPEGLSGEDIPLFGRIMAVADAYDAMTSDRPYRKGMSKEKALSILESGKATQWDSKFVEIFIRSLS